MDLIEQQRTFIEPLFEEKQRLDGRGRLWRDARVVSARSVIHGSFLREAGLVLGKYKVGAGLAVSDMGRARGFYEGKLGLGVAIDSGDNVSYRCGELT